MNLSPLNLVDYKIKSFSFKSVDGLEENELNINAAKICCTQTLRVNKDNESLQMVVLKITITNKEDMVFPYTISLEICGIFETSQIPKEHLQRGVVLRSGTSVLLGAAREYIYTMTAHGIYGPLMFPTLSLLPQSKCEKKKLSKEEKS